ncbi:hypothetical protein OS493_035395 [Desmophyllum pertusum]|uniref:Uncharacterized protein n=1 Tax=Desmophyllum pertusum TaxID=174260 RepID=A0A9W9ZVU5_9CNID|nr:hypothetical protein OS493_035395 [Desmophyllum pertusum]
MAKATATKDFVPFVRNVVLLLLFASSLLTIADGYSCDGCEDNQVCCDGACIDGSSCFGYSCSSIFDCTNGESCCHNDCVNGSDCLGEFCTTDSDCSFDEGCCSLKCKQGYGCVGLSCSTDFDCGSFESCCAGTCSFSDCTDFVVWPVLGSLFGSLFLIFAITLCVYYGRRRRPAYGRGIGGQRILTGTTTNPPYLGQYPPSYQQGYPYYPPPQYVQYPPHNAGTTKSSEPPPPYSGAPEGNPGGVYAPQNTYGAVPNPSLPV